MNPLRRLWEEHGQAVWLDYIERDLIVGGGLERLVADDGVRGVTSNPSIFDQAITKGDAYDGAIDDAAVRAAGPDAPSSSTRRSRSRTSAAPPTCCDRSTTAPDGGDGFVSLEVSPHLAERHRRHRRRGATAVARGRPTAT